MGSERYHSQGMVCGITVEKSSLNHDCVGLQQKTWWFRSMSLLMSSSMRNKHYIVLAVLPITFSNCSAAWLLHDLPFRQPIGDWGTSQDCFAAQTWTRGMTNILGYCLTYKTDWRIGKRVNDLYIQSILYKFCISTWNLCWIIYSQSCLHISVSLGGSTADMALAPKPSQLLHKVFKNARHINHYQPDLHVDCNKTFATK